MSSEVMVAIASLPSTIHVTNGVLAAATEIVSHGSKPVTLAQLFFGNYSIKLPPATTFESVCIFAGAVG